MTVRVSRWLVCWLSLLLVGSAQAQTGSATLRWELGPSGTQVSLRGLCAVSDQVIWASGGEATVIRSEDGGSSWVECGPSGYGQLEFRSIHAWSAARACIASAGTPAMILLTENGGAAWNEVYRNASPQAFFDALRFGNEDQGLAFSDPVDGKLLIVESRDRGRSWQDVAREFVPHALEGEAGFAASNSSLCLSPSGRAWIGTGGAPLDRSRVYYRDAWNAPWTIRSCPLPSAPTQGVFSIASAGALLIASGGDYRVEEPSPQTAVYSTDDGQTWLLAEKSPPGFRSAVIGLPATFQPSGFVTTGPEGSDFSADGKSWHTFSQTGFHSLSASPNLVFAAGSAGRIGVLRLGP